VSRDSRSRGIRRTGEIALWSLIMGLAVVGLLWVMAKLRLVVLPVLLALVLTTFLAPPVHWLRERRWPAAAAAFTVLAVALTVLGGLFIGVLLPTAGQLGELDLSLSDAVGAVRDRVVDSPLPVSAEQFTTGMEQVRQTIGSSFSSISSALLGGVFVALEIVAGLLLSVITAFFLLKDGERIWTWVLGFVSARRRGRADELGRHSWRALGGFVRGQTLVAAFDAVLIGLALVVIGVPLALPLAVLTFFGAFVPVVGATVTGLLAVLVALQDDGVGAAVAVLVAILVVQQIEGNVFQPVIVGRAISVHPLAVLLGVTAGAALAGIIGAMIAAPLVAVAGAVIALLRGGDEDPGLHATLDDVSRSRSPAGEGQRARG
jgi:predicted PurR-regulated permease PerM